MTHPNVEPDDSISELDFIGGWNLLFWGRRIDRTGTLLVQSAVAA